MSVWAAGAATIAAAFAEEERIFLSCDDGELGPWPAILSDVPAPTFDGAGATARTRIYEIERRLVPVRPVNGNLILHRGQRWRVTNVGEQEQPPAFLLTVSRAGSIA